MAASPDSLIHPSRIPNRWVQLMAGIVAMMAIANLQYAWTLFTKPIQAHLHVSLVAVQWTFTLFVALETWLVPFEGYLVDKIGPRFMLGVGAIMVGLGWIGSGYAETIKRPVFLVRSGWYGRRSSLRRHHRERAEMVSGPSRSVRRLDCRSLWHRHGDHDRSHRRHAESFGLPAHVHRLGNYPGSRCAGRGPVPGQATGGMDASELERERSEDQSQSEHFGGRHDAVADAAPAIFLRHLS